MCLNCFNRAASCAAERVSDPINANRFDRNGCASMCRHERCSYANQLLMHRNPILQFYSFLNIEMISLQRTMQRSYWWTCQHVFRYSKQQHHYKYLHVAHKKRLGPHTERQTSIGDDLRLWLNKKNDKTYRCSSRSPLEYRTIAVLPIQVVQCEHYGQKDKE